MHTTHKVDLVTRYEMMRRWFDGDQTTDQVAAEYGLSGSTLRIHLENYVATASDEERMRFYLRRRRYKNKGPVYVTRGGRSITDERQKEILELREQGLSQRAIAEKVGISRKRVIFYLADDEKKEEIRTKERELARKWREKVRKEKALAEITNHSLG